MEIRPALFLRAVRNLEKIKSHDIVYFKHTRNEGCISSSLNGEQYYLKETLNQKQSF